MASQQVEVVNLFVWILIRVTQKERVAMMLRFVFDAAHQFGVKRIGDARDHHADGKAALGPKTAGEQIGLEGGS